MTVPQYAAKFNELARFAPHQVDTEERKTRRFEQGLKPWLYNRLSVLQLESFATILEKAIIAEGGSEALIKFNKEQKNKKNDGGSKGKGISGGNNKRKWNNNNNTRGRDGDSKKKVEACKNCGKNHIGKCLKGKNVCYNCGQEEHIAPNCTNPKNGGCFVFDAQDHQARNCPKKGRDGGSGNKGNNNKLTITRSTNSEDLQHDGQRCYGIKKRGVRYHSGELYRFLCVFLFGSYLFICVI